MRLGVFYLHRHGNDPIHLRGFLKSLSRVKPGISHDLILMLKGFDVHPEEANLVLRSAKHLPNVHSVVPFAISDEGVATTAFFAAAEAFDYDYCMFCTSYTRVLVNNWLRHLFVPHEAVRDCGVTGSTGGWEAGVSGVFPNPSVRTNAYLINRQRFLGLDGVRVKTRQDDLEFEHGLNSMTRQILRAGLKPLIVDKYGQPWEIPDWPRSLTFRSGLQQNLLVHDNWTLKYNTEKDHLRLMFARANWGDEALFTNTNGLRRYWQVARWRWGVRPVLGTPRFVKRARAKLTNARKSLRRLGPP